MPSTADNAPSLLTVLSDDELARYGEIARDQATAELSRWWLQLALVLAAMGTVVWAMARWGIVYLDDELGIEAVGFGRAVMVALAVGAGLAYSPYRRVKNWTLWNRHCKAVQAEKERRSRALATGVRVDVAR